MSEGGKEWDSGCESEGVSEGGKEWDSGCGDARE